MKYRKGVFLVVYRKKSKKTEYLVLKRKLHWKGWEFPKGGFEKNESAEEAVKRELKEETGCRAEKIKEFSIEGKYNYHKKLQDKQGLIGQTYLLFVIKVKGNRIKLDKIEHSAYKWLGFDKAYKTLTWPNQRYCLEMVNMWLNRRKK